MRKKQRDDFDSPWKQAIYLHLKDFLQLCFPNIHSQVDWSLGYEVLDKELPRLTRDAGQNNGYADTLIRLVRMNGLEAWVVLHIEVQSQVDANFPERMYIYNYRVFDKHPGDVVSLAVLGDTQVHWRPNKYQRHLWGCISQLTFPIVKLSEMEAKAMQHLTNPVAG